MALRGAYPLNGPINGAPAVCTLFRMSLFKSNSIVLDRKPFGPVKTEFWVKMSFSKKGVPPLIKGPWGILVRKFPLCGTCQSMAVS